MKPIFIITSVIDFPHKKLSYSSVRSLYSKEERLGQTIETINSIKLYCPNSEIILCEAGCTDYRQELAPIIDTYYYFGEDFITKRAIKSKYKGFGEVAMMYRTLSKIKNMEADRLIFKISGRYFLNSEFSITNWTSQTFNFKKNQETYSTRLYSFPYRFLNRLKMVFVGITPLLLLGMSIEKALTFLIPTRCIKEQKTLGLSGKIAVDLTVISE